MGIYIIRIVNLKVYNLYAFLLVEFRGDKRVGEISRRLTKKG